MPSLNLDENFLSSSEGMRLAKLATMGEMMANITHQWKQPLNELSLILYKMKKLANSEEGEFVGAYERAMQIIKYMADTTDDFSSFLNTNTLSQEFSLVDAARASIQIVKGVMKKEGVHIELEVLADSKICGHKNRLMQVIINLLNNAKDALNLKKIEDKNIKISIDSDDKFAYISVQDNGGGIDESVMDKIFKPYFSTKNNKSTGIGLYMSKQIVEQFNAEITASNSDGGACFSIKLPHKGEIDE
ncbi:HAMP domain-containing sensor histidine kinase [uncultured Campylobacter sp.]|uniref:sensor histidine kinase n=1 Tax=uncultured Campylobacter sp. TaxID=218934 RepID=UPI0026323C1E|nr:HAMP domain-containing sensor histidine kinase [uncultured Campylobacter sp.]